MIERLRGLFLAPVLLLGLVVASSPAGGGGAGGQKAPRGAPARLQVDPASTPGGASEGHSDDGEVRPGRDDPEEFYKKPPRKPKLRTRMHA